LFPSLPHNQRALFRGEVRQRKSRTSCRASTKHQKACTAQNREPASDWEASRPIQQRRDFLSLTSSEQPVFLGR